MLLAGVEERSVGAISFAVISLFITAAGGIVWVFAVLFLYILEQSSKVMTDAWVGFWSEDRFSRGSNDVQFYLGVYCALGMTFGVVTLIRTLTMSFGMVRPCFHSTSVECTIYPSGAPILQL